MSVKFQSAAEMMDGYPLREFLLIGGKDSVGKTSACVSTACWVEMNNPAAVCYVVDSENKFRSALESFKADAPKNIQYGKTESMNEVTEYLAVVIAKHKRGDWLFVESMGAIWDMAQDLAYQAIAGVSRIEYLDAKRGTRFASGVEKKGSPIPNPDDFWSIAKGAYDGAFLNPMRQSETLNVVLTTVAKPIKEPRPGQKESADRKALRIETGMDMNLSGSPTMPSVVETLVLLELNQGEVSCRVLRDNLSALESGRIEFPVPSKKLWAPQFWTECRRGELRL